MLEIHNLNKNCIALYVELNSFSFHFKDVSTINHAQMSHLTINPYPNKAYKVASV